MSKKLKGRALSKFEAGRDVWQEVLDGVREIKSGGDKRSVVEPRSSIVRACRARAVTQGCVPQWRRHDQHEGYSTDKAMSRASGLISSLTVFQDTVIRPL